MTRPSQLRYASHVSRTPGLVLEVGPCSPTQYCGEDGT